jgi:hypothetical protein
LDSAAPNNDALNKNMLLVVSKCSDVWPKRISEKRAYGGINTVAITVIIQKSCMSLLMSQIVTHVARSTFIAEYWVTVMTIHSKMLVDRGCKYFHVCVLGCFLVIYYSCDMQIISNVAGAVGQLFLSESQTFKGLDNTYMHALPLFLERNKFRAWGYVQLLCFNFFVDLILPYIANYKMNK